MSRLQRKWRQPRSRRTEAAGANQFSALPVETINGINATPPTAPWAPFQGSLGATYDFRGMHLRVRRGHGDNPLLIIRLGFGELAPTSSVSAPGPAHCGWFAKPARLPRRIPGLMEPNTAEGARRNQQGGAPSISSRHGRPRQLRSPNQARSQTENKSKQGQLAYNCLLGSLLLGSWALFQESGAFHSQHSRSQILPQKILTPLLPPGPNQDVGQH